MIVSALGNLLLNVVMSLESPLEMTDDTGRKSPSRGSMYDEM